MKRYKAGEFAKLLGIHKLTVFNWQKRGILPDRRDGVNNWRYFTDEDLKTAQAILRGDIKVKN